MNIDFKFNFFILVILFVFKVVYHQCKNDKETRIKNSKGSY